MPRSAPKPCAEPGCPQLVYDGSRCDEHRREYSRDRSRTRFNSANQADKALDDFYKGAAWVRLRRWWIRRNPLCVRCEERGVVTPGRVVDHIVERRDDPSRSLDATNLQTLCHRCHTIKTNEEKSKRLPP